LAGTRPTVTAPSAGAERRRHVVDFQNTHMRLPETRYHALNGPRAELAASFERQEELEAFLADAEIRRESPNDRALFLAGRMWRAYRSSGGGRERIITDFLIGAHAGVQAGRLVTRDRGFYRRCFDGLTVVEP